MLYSIPISVWIVTKVHFKTSFLFLKFIDIFVWIKKKFANSENFHPNSRNEMSSQPAAEPFTSRSSNHCASDTEEPTQNKSTLKPLNLNELYTKNDSLFNTTSITNNSSGLGESISLASLSADCSSSNSSVYGGCNTVNAAYSSCSSSESMLDTSSSFLSTNQDACKNAAGGQKAMNLKAVTPECNLSSLSHQLNVLNLNQVDYDPFNDYMGIDKMILQVGYSLNTAWFEIWGESIFLNEYRASINLRLHFSTVISLNKFWWKFGEWMRYQFLR